MTFHLIPRLFWIAAIISLFTVCRAATVMEDSACYGTSDTGNCSTHDLHCQQGKGIFIVEAKRGFRHQDFGCLSQRDNCFNTEICCSYNRSDCMKQYTIRTFFSLTNVCLRRGACIYRVPRDYRKSPPCNATYLKESGYSHVRYLCLEDSSITSFTTSTSVLGSAIAVVYNRSQDSTSDRDKHLTCRVDAADCCEHKTSILLYKSPNKKTSHQFTSLGLSSNSWLRKSSQSGVYLTRRARTPFNLSLRIVSNDNVDVGLAVIYALDETKMRVTCRAKNDAFPDCVVPTTSTTEPTQSTETSPSREITATTTEANLSREATPNLSEVSTLYSAEPTSDDGDYSGIHDERADMSSNKDKVKIVGVAAGTAGGLVLLAAAVAIATVCYRRRRAPKDTSSQDLTTFKDNSNHGTTPQSRHYTLDAESPDLGSTNPALSSTRPAVSPALGQAAPGTAVCPTSGDDNSEGDYDHLGSKRPSPAPRSDVIYGHLSGAADVTESDYDHVMRNRKPVSDDVIDNLYDTTMPAMSARRGDDDDNDDYNVLGASGRRHDVVNNIYDTAGPPPAMGAGDEVDYNALGAAQSRPDVINNIYSNA